MKSSSIIVLLLCFGRSMSEMTLCAENCPVDEVYSKCNAGRCEPNCWSLNGPSVCPCTTGCVCRPGLIRDPNTFKCIPPQKCSVRRPGQCPLNEFWSSNAGCQRNCNTIDVLFKCKPSPGCICRNGFIRSSINDQCIPVNSCKTCPPGYSLSPKTGKCNFCCQECQENEEYNECGSFCPADCKNPSQANIICIAGCKPGCFCKEGFLRDASGKCIPKDKCNGKYFFCNSLTI